MSQGNMFAYLLFLPFDMVKYKEFFKLNLQLILNVDNALVSFAFSYT